MEKVKDRAIRIWYMQGAIEHGWSRAVLTVQIETQAHKRMAAEKLSVLSPPV